MLSLAIVTFPPSSSAISSSAGPIMRHGPHHSAQKSTSTGVLLEMTSLWNEASVTFLVAKIGRASCRERVSVRVDLGGRRIIKKKNNEHIQHKPRYMTNTYVED